MLVAFGSDLLEWSGSVGEEAAPLGPMPLHAVGGRGGVSMDDDGGTTTLRLRLPPPFKRKGVVFPAAVSAANVDCSGVAADWARDIGGAIRRAVRCDDAEEEAAIGRAVVRAPRLMIFATSCAARDWKVSV